MSGFSTGTSVLTTKLDSRHLEQYTPDERQSKKWGVEGIIMRMTAHEYGPYYIVEHWDGSVGVYEPTELIELVDLQ